MITRLPEALRDDEFAIPVMAILETAPQDQFYAWAACVLHLHRLDLPSRDGELAQAWSIPFRSICEAIVDGSLGVAGAVRCPDPLLFVAQEQGLLAPAVRRAAPNAQHEAALSILADSIAFVRWEITGASLRSRLDESLRKDGTTVSETALYSTLAIAVIVAIAVLLIAQRIRRRPPSREFAALAALGVESEWSRKLLSAMASERWSLSGAWPAARLNDDEKRDAIGVLTQLKPLACAARAFPAGGAFDANTMQPRIEGRHGFVLATVRPALMQDHLVIEKALVDAGTADFVALSRIAHDPRSNEYLTRNSLRVEPSTVMTPEFLGNLADSLDPVDFDEWLERLIAAAPTQTLRAAAELGEHYSERTMQATRRPPRPAHAVVVARKHRGLCRGEQVLVKAFVDAKERDE